MTLALMMFATCIALVAIFPSVVNENKFSSLNWATVQAQFAAEAGAKVAAESLYTKSKVWNWLGTATAFNAADTNQTYKVTLSPTIANGFGPVAGTTYTITSVGSVLSGGTAITKTVTAKVTVGGAGGSSLPYGVYSTKDMSIWSGGTIKGNAATSGNLRMDGKITGDVYAVGNFSSYGGSITGNLTYGGTYDQWGRLTLSGTKTNTKPSLTSYNVADYVKAAPTMPTMPTYTRTGTDISKLSSGSALTTGSYYYNGNWSPWAQNFTIAPGQSVVLYVNGDFSMGQSSFTGGGNLTVYAKGNISMGNSSSIAGGTVALYAATSGKKTSAIALGGGSSISGGVITLQSTGTLSFSDNNPTITGTTVGLYAGDTISFSTGTVTGSAITLQTSGDISLSSGSPAITAASGGSVSLYSTGTFALNSGAISGAAVTAIVGSSSSSSSIGFTGGSINPNLAGSVTKIYLYGNIGMSSSSIGTAGSSMILATGTLGMSGGSMPNTLLMAGGDAQMSGGTCGGIYTNGTFAMSGGTINYSADLMSNLGFAAGEVPFAIKSWGS